MKDGTKQRYGDLQLNLVSIVAGGFGIGVISNGGSMYKRKKSWLGILPLPVILTIQSYFPNALRTICTPTEIVNKILVQKIALQFVFVVLVFRPTHHTYLAASATAILQIFRRQLRTYLYYNSSHIVSILLKFI